MPERGGEGMEGAMLADDGTACHTNELLSFRTWNNFRALIFNAHHVAMH